MKEISYARQAWQLPLIYPWHRANATTIRVAPNIVKVIADVDGSRGGRVVRPWIFPTGVDNLANTIYKYSLFTGSTI
jgi:hypothetical protein